MAQDSEKRFHSIIDKLYHAPKSVPHSSSSSGVQLSGGRKRPYSTASGVMESNVRGDVSEGQQPSSTPAGSPQGPLCRPWDRGDFMRRLATFKSITWFAKPKVVSAVNCARRGWINVDVDIIACEACGTRLLFSTPASWNQQQVEKAALVFSLKLDNGHKLLCPWIDNACDETVARFPPTPPPILVDNFRERCSALLQLSALPRILSSATEYVKNPLLEEFLKEPSTLECGKGSANNFETVSISNQHEAKLYNQALKLISLCGWKPRSLPYLVDCKDGSNQCVKSTIILDRSPVVTDVKNNNLTVHSANTDEDLKTDKKYEDSSGEQIDPNSVVLDCGLCGATVGLWAFCLIPRPIELLRLVGYTEVNGENGSGTHNSFDECGLESRQDVTSNLSDIATSSKNKSSSLNMTIAGGPLPTKQNFKATISLPVIGQNLRARISYDSDFRDHLINGDGTQSGGPIVPTSSERREVFDNENTSQANIHDLVVDDVTKSTKSAGQTSTHKDKMLIHAHAVDENSSARGDPSNSQRNMTEDEALSVSQKTSNGQLSNLENSGVKDTVEKPLIGKAINYSSGKDLVQVLPNKAMEFDPIRQHRHFCPWIASLDNGEPGWQRTLSALYNQKDNLHSSPNRSPASMSILKVDDPIGSVRKLFTSPSTKRLKPTRISDRSTEHR
ncbi:hypothetical protein L6164_011313 [Bauhinia variegata]|uniref:Uncharacterized protein n=1 Tax=Bauhinia variegata TaxID=167791 RepID=A0ACB9P6U4_BAUVA|nr:hypothetical protein L6164_011313 [Bauhinia variegata]